MALRILIVVKDASDQAAKDRFGVKLMEATSEFDSGVEITAVDDARPGLGLRFETLNAMAESGTRAEASILLLQDLFGMETEEARATFNQLEDRKSLRWIFTVQTPDNPDFGAEAYGPYASYDEARGVATACYGESHTNVIPLTPLGTKS